MKNFNILVEEKKYLRVRFGLRYDEFHLGEFFIQPAYENLFGSGIRSLLHIQYGLRREKYSLEFQADHLFTTNLAYNLLIQMYLSKDRIFQRDVYKDSTNTELIYFHEKTLIKTGFIALLGTSLGKSTLLSAGIKLERFRVQVSNKSAIGDYFGLEYNILPYFLLKLNIDSMDKYPLPSSGIRHFIMIGGTGKSVFDLYNENFVNLLGSFGGTFTIAKKHSFSPRIQFAWASSTLPAVERLYLGGIIPEDRYREMSVYNLIQFTGLSPRAMFGDIMALFHFDYRLNINKYFFPSFMVDWGYTWDKKDFPKNSAIEQFISYAPLGLGLSLQYVSIIGPIRLSFGQTIKSLNQKGIKSQGVFYFSAGHDF